MTPPDPHGLDRDALDEALDRLAAMLPAWCSHLRHQAQFRPQFDALAARILARTRPGDRAYALARIDAMLAAERAADSDAGPHRGD